MVKTIGDDMAGRLLTTNELEQLRRGDFVPVASDVQAHQNFSGGPDPFCLEGDQAQIEELIRSHTPVLAPELVAYVAGQIRDFEDP